MTAPRQNIELKARLASLPTARQVARRLCTEYLGHERQVDTYFHAPIRATEAAREIETAADTSCLLIAYQRPDQSDSKQSDYHLLSITDPATCKAALRSVLGVRAVVDKRREIFLVDNVRIHLDEVQNLGCFLEFEAVLSEHIDPQQGHQQVLRLQQEFALKPEDLLHGSYGELILEEANSK